MSKFAKIALVAALVGACTSATAGEIRTEIYAEGATDEGSKVLYWDIYTATAPSEGQALVLLHGGGCRGNLEFTVCTVKDLPDSSGL